jgi:MFS family permease
VGAPRETSRREAWRLGLLFGALAFLQGIGEPTDGLMAQPVRSLLKGWGRTAGEIAAFSAMLSLPWVLKPLFGLLSDFVPLGGTRRKGYLMLAGGSTALCLLGLYRIPVPAGASASRLAWLIVPAIAVAMADVVTDALLVERGQPRRLTGLLLAVQWGCLYLAGIVNGLLGGRLSVHPRQPWAFLACGLGGVLTLVLAVSCIREPAGAGDGARPEDLPGPRATLAAIGRAFRPGPGSLLGVGGFLFLWHFNPFSNDVLYVHMTGALGFSEAFFGGTVALTAVAAILASVGYGLYGRRVPPPVLVHASIVLGIASTLAYTVVIDARSAVLVTLAAGVTYMTATLIQLDLAARACPREAAGTVFALIMAAENLAASLASWLGGVLYDRGLQHWGGRRAFQVLVLVSSLVTAGCWLLVPLLPMPRPDAPDG